MLLLRIAKAVSMDLYYPEDILSKVLDSEPRFTNAEQEEKTQRLVDALSEEDREIAARTSYAYWYASRRGPNDHCLTPTIRNNMAKKEARRHLVGKGGDENLARKTLQASLEYRKEYGIDALRLCFVTNPVFATDDERILCTKFQTQIETELPKQHLIVRGMDKDSRPITVYLSRQEVTSTAAFDTEAFLITRLYVAERATAAVEFLTAGQEEKLTVFFRTGDYVRANAPPVSAIQKMVTLLQRNYPERLHKFVWLDAPLWMRTLFSLLRYFLDETTASKLVMVSGEEERERVVSDIVSSDQAMPFMLSDGKLGLPMEPAHYLHQVPFYCPYDETPATSMPRIVEKG
ncbi:CRAL/TRIO domain containing protein [Fragilaria crotonensis]|nr:CRAL/TRIO domain containing protein [Fragilaria crotonensis]